MITNRSFTVITDPINVTRGTCSPRGLITNFTRRFLLNRREEHKLYNDHLEIINSSLWDVLTTEKNINCKILRDPLPNLHELILMRAKILVAEAVRYHETGRMLEV